MTIVGIWLGYEANWIRERRMLVELQAERIARLPSPLRNVEVYRDAPKDQPLSVSILNCLGEPSRQMLMIVIWGQPAGGKADDLTLPELQRAADLFPESIISWVGAN